MLEKSGPPVVSLSGAGAGGHYSTYYKYSRTHWVGRTNDMIYS